MKNTGLEIFTAIEKLWKNPGLRIVIVPHENPDGDAVGSAIGLGEVLQHIGHTVHIVTPNDYPPFLKWFSSEIPVIIYEKKKQQAKEIFRESDLLICVDFNEPGRAGKLEKLINIFSGKKILIDHHPYPANFCDFQISEQGYSSTSELIFDVLKNTGLSNHILKRSAEALYTGIMTDTGSFSHNITNPNPFKVVSHLMEKGIDISKIQSNVYHNYSSRRMNLLGYCLNEKMEVFPELRSAVITISSEDQKRFEFTTGDSEGFVNYPLSIKNIVFSALFVEKENLVKASFRSKGNFPANAFSRENFNGGGHLNAAGGESNLTLNETIIKFRQLLEQYKHLLEKTEI